MKKNNEEHLKRCVVDTMARKFYLYSSEGSEKIVDCETTEQFLNVLKLVREKLGDDVLAYSNPL